MCPGSPIDSFTNFKLTHFTSDESSSEDRLQNNSRILSLGEDPMAILKENK